MPLGQLLKSDRRDALSAPRRGLHPITVPTMSFAGEAGMYTALSPLQLYGAAYKSFPDYINFFEPLTLELQTYSAIRYSPASSSPHFF